jgi:F5/8 type C domain/WD40-like Beta Propeller Repeat
MKKPQLRIIKRTYSLLKVRGTTILIAFFCTAGSGMLMITSQAQTPGIKTDRAVYPEPPLPTLPSMAGGKFNDPTFGTQIMRATDESDCPAPGCGTYYSHWPTFNTNNTYILMRKGVNGSALIKPFDAVNFTISPGHQPSGISVQGVGTVSMNFESAIWHPTDPHLIYCFPISYDGGMKLYTYNAFMQQYSSTPVKDFSSLGGPQDYLKQMSMSADGDVFAWSQMRNGYDQPVAYIVWRKSTNQVLVHNTTNGLVNEVRIDKSGRYLSIPFNEPVGRTWQKGDERAQVLDLQSGQIDTYIYNDLDRPAGHGDAGTGITAGADPWRGGINKRNLNNIHSGIIQAFDFKSEDENIEWTEDFHGSLLADNETWMTIGTYDMKDSPHTDYHILEDEIVQVSLDGSQQIRRLAHTRTDILDSRVNYAEEPKPTISKDGRFIAFTSNWENPGGRTDLFILKIDPAPPTTQFLRTNVARSSNGGIATASTSYDDSSWHFPASGANNGDRRGRDWGNNGGWQDSTPGDFSNDWLQIEFDGNKAIDEVDVFTVQDNYSNPSVPTSNMTFNYYGVKDYSVQYWNGSQWLNVPGGIVSNNNLVWKKITFSPITTSKIRVLVSAAADGYSRLTEVEAWGVPAAALAAPGKLGVTLTTNNITKLLWTDNSDNETGFKIERRAAWSSSAPWTSYTTVGPNITTLEINESYASLYYYRVRSLKGSEESAPTNEAWCGCWSFDDNTPRENVALTANGGVASASSSLDVPGWHFTPAGANDGERKGSNWGSGGGWQDSTSNSFPDWLQIDFDGNKFIDEVDVFTVQDNYANPSEPTETMTFNLYGLTGYQVQYLSGSNWVDVPGGNVSGNNLVWKKITFSPIMTTKIRVLMNGAVDAYSRLTEVQAWGIAAAPRVNVALSSNGAVATASSSLDVPGWHFVSAGANDGERKGLNWGSNGGWQDSTSGVFDDVLQIEFNQSKTIDEIDVFTVQDNYYNPSEPTETMAFSLYGLTSYEVQYWNGTSWVTVPGGSISGNNLVWKKATFSPITTTKIRVLTKGAVDGYSRLTEVEAWGN